MAFFDDPKFLIAHLRHSFITSDDSGMCELIMINEDLDNEIKSDHKFSKKSFRMAQRYNPADHLPKHAAKSYDIHASPTLSRRPPMKNTSNMFEVVEQRRKKKSSQIRTIMWQDSNNVFDPSLFPRQEIPKKPKETEPSRLTQLLAEYNKLSANPYFEYGRFNGENHGFAVANVYRIFLPMSKSPLRPIMVTILHKATITDLIGLTFWKYTEETENPVKLGPVSNYAIMIAEEDGDIDTDLPALEREDRVAKFRFKYLGIVELKPHLKLDEPKHVVVKVHYEHGGFSTLAIENANVEMGEILSKVIRKRRLQIHGYELEKKDNPGFAVDLGSTLDSQGTLDFILVKHIGRRHTAPISVEEESVDSRQTHVKAELTSHQYKSYRVVLIHKVRSNTEVLLGVSGQFIEVDPVGQSRSGLPSLLRTRSAQKSNKYEIKKICACEILDDKNLQRVVFRITRTGKEDGTYKNLDFEAPVAIAKEIVRKIGLILEGISGGAKTEYEEWKEQSKGRKSSKSVSLVN